MSIDVMRACWPLQMPPTPKATLIALADHASDQGSCWPSLTKLCKHTCFGRTAVIDAIKWLEAHGALVADRSNRYSTKYVVTPNSFLAIEPVRQTNQSASATSSDGNELVRLADNEVRETDDEVRQADTNHQEPSITIIQSNRHSPRTSKSASERFDEFWTAYPRKVGSKAKAEKSWATQKLDAIADQILADVQARTADDPQWRDTQFIPHPTTYLNGQRWNDQWRDGSKRPSVNDRFRGSNYEGSPDHEIPDYLVGAI